MAPYKKAVIPLIFGTVPFFSRQVETALANVSPGKIEAARAMGSGTFGLIFRVYLHEAVPELARVTTITAISLVGLTTMAGAVGAGGIGAALIVGIEYRKWNDVGALLWGIVILVLIIELVSTKIRKSISSKD